MILPPDGPPAHACLVLLSDRRLPQNAVQRVYVVMWQLLKDARQPMTFSADYVGRLVAGVENERRATGPQRAPMSREEVYRHWHRLVEAGLLVEHARDERRKRYFSLPVAHAQAA